MLGDEAIERLLLALERALAGPLGHHVQHRHLRPEALARGRGPGAWPARRADRRAPAPGSSVTWSRPRCLTTAMSHGDSRTTASMVGEKTAGAGAREPRAASARRRGRCRRRSAPAEDDEVGALLADRLDHAVGGAPADADHGPDLDALLVAEVEDALSRRRAVRAWVAPSDSDTPSGTSTMPRAVISVARPLLTPAPMRTRSRAVRGLASGSRMRYGARRGGHQGSSEAAAAHLAPARHEVGLELLELRAPGRRSRARPGRSSSRASRR